MDCTWAKAQDRPVHILGRSVHGGKIGLCKEELYMWEYGDSLRMAKKK